MNGIGETSMLFPIEFNHHFRFVFGEIQKITLQGYLSAKVIPKSVERTKFPPEQRSISGRSFRNCRARAMTSGFNGFRIPHPDRFALRPPHKGGGDALSIAVVRRLALFGLSGSVASNRFLLVKNLDTAIRTPLWSALLFFCIALELDRGPVLG
ncbi:MAG TPA: hypothetical protein VG309_11505 [Rhizomicrobium sp.]|nr:hypothetical protein [Rhizomicrobium sp.]